MRNQPFGMLVLCPLLLCLGAFAGCQAPPALTVQTFRAPPAGWAELGGKPTALSVENAHLDLSSDVTFEDPTDFRAGAADSAGFSLVADVAFVGGDPRGIAGVFVRRVGAAQPFFYCLAVRPGGESRVYRGAQPLEPVGGRGWQPSDHPAGFFRLGVQCDGRSLTFLLDGKKLDQYSLGESSGEGADDRGEDLLRVGIFNRGGTSRWKNFIAGEVALRQLGEHEFCGDASDGTRLLERATKEAREFRSRPTRMGLYYIVASLEESKRIQKQLGDAGKPRLVAQQASKIAAYVRDSARSIGEGDLHERSFGKLLAGEAAGGGAAGEEFAKKAREAEEAGSIGAALCLYLAADPEGADPSIASRVQALKAKLPPLRLDFSASSKVAKPIFDPKEFWQAAREVYGGIPRDSDGQLRIVVEIEKSANEAESVKSERRVAAALKDGGRLQDLYAERAKLEKSWPEDLADAQAHTNVLRNGAKILGPESLDSLREFRFGQKTYELPVNDGTKIQKTYLRRTELEAAIKKEESQQTLNYVSIPATLHTNSILVQVSYGVELDGKRLLDVNGEKTYLGVEQWSHAADEKRGVPAARFQRGEVDQSVESVRDRVLSRFRTAISTENVLSKLAPEDRLPFLILFARATRSEEAVTNLEWILRQELGLEGSALKAVGAACLK